MIFLFGATYCDWSVSLCPQPSVTHEPDYSQCIKVEVWSDRGGLALMLRGISKSSNKLLCLAFSCVPEKYPLPSTHTLLSHICHTSPHQTFQSCPVRLLLW